MLASACSTNGQLATVEPPAPPETFAMLPDTVPSVPYGREDAAPKAVAASSLSSAIAAAGYVSSGSMQIPAVSQNPEVDRLITTYAANYEVPESLVRRVVKRESNFRPEARNGPYWGLMQILPATARGMGFSGKPVDLLDAETNLKYAVKYLKGAYLVAGGDHDQAVRNYARGYYYDAKRKGLLEATGLKARSRMPETLVASAGANVPASAVAAGPASNVASQWETGFVTATAGKSKGLAMQASAAVPVKASASRSSRIASANPASPAPSATAAGVDGEVAMGFGPAGAASTPSLGLPAE